MSDTKTVHEKMSTVGARVSGQVDDMLDDARPVISRMSHRVQDELHDLSESGKEALADAKHKLEKEARHVHETTTHWIQHDPIRSVLIAAGTGAVAALAVAWFVRSRQQ